MPYNFDKTHCDRCGISKSDRQKLPAMETGIKHPVYNKTKSFYLSNDGEVFCPECHKELELEKLFEIIDKKLEKKGEKNE